MQTIIIGSGVSGLICAATLAQAGHSVTVFEQFHRAGGSTAPFERDGFRWDLGQLLVEGFGPDEPTGQVLAALGIADRVRVKQDDRRYVFPDFDLLKPQEYGGPRWRIERLKELFPAESAGLERYYRDLIRFTRLMTAARKVEQAEGPARLAAQARMYAALLPFFTRMNWNAQQVMDNYFKSEQLKAVFMSILADFFTPPSKFQGLGVFALNPETSFDSRVPAELAPGAVQLHYYSILGGIGTLVDALVARIVELGGQVLPGRPVEKVLVENGKVKGVQDRDGNVLPADVVIASGAVNEVFFNLVGEEHLPADFAARVRAQPLMDSVFMVHLGLDYDPSVHTGGAVAYYYGTYDLENGISEAAQGLYHEGRAGFVVHVPTHHSPEMAPEGMHAMTIYTICPDRLSEGTWSERRVEFADKLVAYAEAHIPGLREHTVTRAIMTPDDFHGRLGVDHHAFGGLAPWLGTRRIPAQTPIAGLWFTGQQGESGGGTYAVIMAAYKMAKKIAGK
ncbi:MAG: NAD(P)/FAD-dependent oxidoreductase [Anaerolineaceae bacterium]|nr:NAD(P)/FAD-dependent oxidoreductase [Anaerolineaceae bacterium]